MDESWDVGSPTTIEVGTAEAPVREVRVQLIGGRAAVVARREETDETTGTAVLEVTDVKGRPLQVTYADGVLEVRTPQLTWSSLLETVRVAVNREDSAELAVSVPAGTPVRLGTLTAEGVVSGVTAGAKVRTVSGRVTVDDVRGDLEARTVSGTIEVTGQDGPVDADSVSGSLTVQARRLPRLSAGTVSGSLTVDIASAPARLTAKTVSGDVTVRMPAGAGFRLDARSVSGAVVAGGERLAGRPGSVEGSLGDGDDVRVTARTVSGDITLLHAAAPERSPLTLEKAGPA